MTTKTDIEQERALLPCPFCGGEAHIERIGTPRQSCQIACGNCGAWLETGEQGKECGNAWNRRAALQDQPADHAEFELVQYGVSVASATGKREDAWREIQHYAAVYSQDDPVEIYEVIRRRIEGEQE